MGCDIHLYVEEQQEDGTWELRQDLKKDEDHPLYDADNNWRNKQPFARSRDYDFYSRLAGVRGEGPDPIGLPEDADRRTLGNLDAWESDAHSVTWMPLDKFLNILLDCNKDSKGGLKAIAYPAYYYMNLKITAENYPKYRVIMWFDN